MLDGIISGSRSPRSYAFLRVMLLSIVSSFGILTRSSSSPSYNIRFARREDIPGIRNCNLENLPENYTDEFYTRHLASWPALSMIAESKEDERLIGYALARVEASATSAKKVVTVGKNDVYLPPQMIGHVASIAVYESHRGQGVAKALMKALHSQLVNAHSVDQVSLHCRVSNVQAIRLYSSHFPYRCTNVVPSYYADGEHAWRMDCSNLSKLVASGGTSKSLQENIVSSISSTSSDKTSAADEQERKSIRERR